LPKVLRQNISSFFDQLRRPAGVLKPWNRIRILCSFQIYVWNFCETHKFRVMNGSLKGLKMKFDKNSSTNRFTDGECDCIRSEIDSMVFSSEFSRQFRIFVVKTLISLSSCLLCLTASHFDKYSNQDRDYRYPSKQ